MSADMADDVIALRRALMRLTEICPTLVVDLKLSTPNQLVQEAIDYVANLKLELEELKANKTGEQA